VPRPVLWCATLGLAALLCAEGAEATKPDTVEIAIKNVNYRIARDVVLQVRYLRGQLAATRHGSPVTFDDRTSFAVHIDSAEVAISPASLAALLNSYVFDYPGAPLKNVSITIGSGGRVRQKGTMHKGVDLPFEVEGSFSATADGSIRLHAQKIESAHIPFKGLLHLFGENLSKLVNLNEARGVRIEGDDIVMYPGRMTPPPAFDGHVTAVRVEANNIVEVFDSGRAKPPLRPPLVVRSYIYHRGGTLRFGKLTMNDADLEIVGSEPEKEFDFFLAEYNRRSRDTPRTHKITA
jgi:hypothetical protein